MPTNGSSIDRTNDAKNTQAKSLYVLISYGLLGAVALDKKLLNYL